MDHRKADVAQCADILREEEAPERVEQADDLCDRDGAPEAGRGLNKAGSEEIDRLERELSQVVLGLPFDTSPHQASLFGAVGPGAGDVAKGHCGIEFRERAGRAERPRGAPATRG